MALIHVTNENFEKDVMKSEKNRPYRLLGNMVRSLQNDSSHC